VDELHVGPHGAVCATCIQDSAAALSALSEAGTLRHIFITVCAGLTSLPFGHPDEAARLGRAALSLAATDDERRTVAWGARQHALHGIAVDALKALAAPGFVDHVMLSYGHYELGQWDAARTALEAVPSPDSNDERDLLALARTALAIRAGDALPPDRLAEFDEDLRDLDLRAISGGSGPSRAHICLVLLALDIRRERYADARELYARIRDWLPEHLTPYYHLGVLATHQDDHAAAAEHWLKAITLFPSDTWQHQCAAAQRSGRGAWPGSPAR
jgi:tetratricopeptide (TPR) repeat protein